MNERGADLYRLVQDYAALATDRLFIGDVPVDYSAGPARFGEALAQAECGVEIAASRRPQLRDRLDTMLPIEPSNA